MAAVRVFTVPAFLSVAIPTRIFFRLPASAGLALLAQSGYFFLAFFQFSAGSFSALIPLGKLAGVLATALFMGIGLFALLPVPITALFFPVVLPLLAFGKLIALGAKFFQLAMTLGILPNGIVSQADGGALAAFVVFLPIAAREIATIGFIPAHHLDIVPMATKAGRAEAFIP